jgi:OOP family OmpA-OmpF porin
MRFRAILGALCITTCLFSMPALAQSQLTEGQILQSLAGTGRAAKVAGINISAVRQDIEARVRAGGGTNAVNTPPALQALSMLPNLTLVIHFDFDSVRIQPDSYETIARIADALHHPLLMGFKFVVVGHTDSKGTREYNLTLSQNRANAVVEALTTTFHVPPNQLAALGVGEEQPGSPTDTTADFNRRVQLLNLGPL